jgi:sulfatase modifying factor 1
MVAGGPRGSRPATPGRAPHKDMAWIQGGTFLMGSEDFYPEEGPVHQVTVDGFWIDAHPVTNAEFRRFVKATGYVTVAEHPPDPADYPDADPALLVPGALVFQPARGPVDLRDWRNWWAWVPGACWRHPEGPGSTLHGRDRHPVVQVAYADAQAYAAWAGKTLPSEAEWEYAARGGLDGAVFAWGDEFAPRGRMLANTWQGEFPWRNLLLDRYAGTSPVGAFPPNGYGLSDMTGNVWEWTSDYFALQHPRRAERPCCVPRHPPGDRPGPGRADPPPGDQGRLAPVRTQLLPALPAGRPPGRGGRHRHRPHGLSLHPRRPQPMNRPATIVAGVTSADRRGQESSAMGDDRASSGRPSCHHDVTSQEAL